jgi:hypothetical protein
MRGSSSSSPPTRTRSTHGSGQILITATKSLDASAPATGTMVYGGNPEEYQRADRHGAISAK